MHKTVDIEILNSIDDATPPDIFDFDNPSSSIETVARVFVGINTIWLDEENIKIDEV